MNHAMHASLPSWLALPGPGSTYQKRGWALIPIPPGKKRPAHKDWNLPNNCHLPEGWQGNIGLAHAYCQEPTCAIDIDNWLKASKWLDEHGIDLQALYNASGAVVIESGKSGHGKVIYRLPDGCEPLETKQIVDDAGQTILEFRCATAGGKTVQDVIHGTHPETGKPYQWRLAEGESLDSKLENMPRLPTELLDVWQQLIERARTIPATAETTRHADWRNIESALECVSPDCSRDEWIRIGMSLHAADAASGQSYGFWIWDEWSQASVEKYPGEREMAHQWQSFSANKANGVALGTLFHIAHEHGYRETVNAEALFAGVSPKDAGTATATHVGHKSWGDLMGVQFDPIDWVVADLIPPGVSLLVGRPKQGKSWLVHALALMVAAGKPVFGLQTHKSPVLYMALEDSERRIQGRTRKLIQSYGLSDADLKRTFHFQTKAPRLGEGLERQLTEKVGSIAGLRLIIVDVLAQVRQPRKGNQSVYEADYEVGKQLKAVAGLFPDIAILVVHHANKGAGDALDAVSGTNGLSGGMDNIFTLMSGATGMELHINGRDIEDSSMIPLTKREDGMWTLASRRDARDTQRSESRAAVIKAMEGGAASPKEIAEAANLSTGVVDQQLRRMVIQNEVIKTGRGTYVLFEGGVG